jgi:hypothetical protein
MPAMAMEHQPSGPPVAPAAGDQPAAARALRAQLLATEHWSLLATRSLSWNESFSRASMFLTLLSGATVALALVAQATSFGDGFSVFALLLLPVVLYVGGATFVRLTEINNEDLVWVRGMNRLRRAYLELDPDLARHFITGTTEDAAGYMKTFGAPATGSAVLHGLVTTPATIGIVNAAVAAVLVAVASLKLGGAMGVVAGAGVVTFFAAAALQGWYGYRATDMAEFGTVARRGAGPDASPDAQGGEA